MRARLMVVMGAVGLSVGFSQPAPAGWDDSYCCAGTVYTHHHRYDPPRSGHFYHGRAVHYRYAHGCCAPVYAYRSRDYFAPRYYWSWRGRPW